MLRSATIKPLSEIQTIIETQMSREQKQALADDIVVNDGHLEHLYAQLQTIAFKVFGPFRSLKKAVYYDCFFCCASWAFKLSCPYPTPRLQGPDHPFPQDHIKSRHSKVH